MTTTSRHPKLHLFSSSHRLHKRWISIYKLAVISASAIIDFTVIPAAKYYGIPITIASMISCTNVLIKVSLRTGK